MVLGHVHCSHLDDVAIARINLAKFAAISKEGVPCPFRKSYPNVLVMQPSQDRNGDNGARPLDCSVQGRIFL